MMKKRFVYFYFMKSFPDEIKEAAPSHVGYWKNCNLPGYMGGPFADRSGGLISFVAANLEEAANIVMNDPFVLENLLEDKWIKEWVAE
jgi:uncharacterized protein YciI